MHAEYWEGEGGIHHSQIASGYLFPFVDLLAFPRHLEIWKNQDFIYIYTDIYIYIPIFAGNQHNSQPIHGGVGSMSESRLLHREKIHKGKPSPGKVAP